MRTPFFFSLVAGVAIAACGESGPSGPVAVASVAITPASDTCISLGETMQLTAIARDKDESAISGKSFTWASDDESVATVSSAGVVTSVANGSATITATTDDVSGTASMTVAQVVATVAVAPASDTLTTVGETLQLSATARDGKGSEVSGKTFSWESSDESVATVSSGGLVTAVADGSATITAAADEIDGTAKVTVTTAGGIRLGVWAGTLPSAPAGSGTLSFQVTSATSMTFLSTKVPTFNNMSGCSRAWNNVVTIESDGSFSTTLTSGNTSITIQGTFDSDTVATGTISGVCSGSLMLLGQTFHAEWVSS